MAEYGLGAIIFYEIPFKSSSELENTDNDKNYSPQCNDQWTLGSVFGDGDPGSETGMSVEELLEGIDARIVYVPLYACTSFVVRTLALFFPFIFLPRNPVAHEDRASD
ncbi:hypothetical protein DFH05DRAFT_1512144, partial [Lentinula detonsa]